MANRTCAEQREGPPQFRRGLADFRAETFCVSVHSGAQAWQEQVDSELTSGLCAEGGPVKERCDPHGPAYSRPSAAQHHSPAAEMLSPMALPRRHVVRLWTATCSR